MIWLKKIICIMVLEKFQFQNNKIFFLVIIFVITIYSKTIAQRQPVLFDSIFNSIFNTNLDKIQNNFLQSKNKPILIVSSINCIGCVNYFMLKKSKYFFIFIINNKSLLEVNKILALYKLKKEEIYFTTCSNINILKFNFCQKPTPCLLYKNNFYDYTSLSQISEEFTLKYKLLRKKLNLK